VLVPPRVLRVELVDGREHLLQPRGRSAAGLLRGRGSASGPRRRWAAPGSACQGAAPGRLGGAAWPRAGWGSGVATCSTLHAAPPRAARGCASLIQRATDIWGFGALNSQYIVAPIWSRGAGSQLQTPTVMKYHCKSFVARNSCSPVLEIDRRSRVGPICMLLCRSKSLLLGHPSAARAPYTTVRRGRPPSALCSAMADAMADAKRPLVVVGSINADLVLKVDRVPKPGETLGASSLEFFPGGKVWRAGDTNHSQPRPAAARRLPAGACCRAPTRPRPRPSWATPPTSWARCAPWCTPPAAVLPPRPPPPAPPRLPSHPRHSAAHRPGLPPTPAPLAPVRVHRRSATTPTRRCCGPRCSAAAWTCPTCAQWRAPRAPR
jgi:hypothetical protein